MAKPARHPRRGFAPPPNPAPPLPGALGTPVRAVGPGGGRVRRPQPEAEPGARGFVPALALLPLRAFFGFTFLYAGVDKLMDPTFFNPLAPNGIQHQLLGYVRTSPLSDLIQAFAVPHAETVGLAVALLEIAIGVGALTGILFRFAALGGALVSFMFFLTASWAVHPFYFGQDLPYMFGWITLAAAGHGDLYVLGPWLGRQIAGWQARGASRFSPPPEPMSPSRRMVLELGLVGGAALAVAALTRPLRLIAGSDTALPSAATTTGDGTTAQSAAPAASSASAQAAGGATTSSGSSAAEVGTVSQLDSAGAISFTVPTSTGNPNVVPGDPAVLLKLHNGSIVAFDAVCTHQGCPVEYDPQSGFLACPCHGAMFDPNNKAAVVAGPAPLPLTELPIQVDKSTGAISLRA